MSGRVIVARLEKKEKKGKMQNKCKLRGDFFIEHDLTWKGKKVQEQIRQR